MTRLATRLLLLSAYLLLAGVAYVQLWIASAAAQTADKADVKKSASAWHVRCNDNGSGMRCRASQTIALRKSRKRLLAGLVSVNGWGLQYTRFPKVGCESASPGHG